MYAFAFLRLSRGAAVLHLFVVHFVAQKSKWPFKGESHTRAHGGHGGETVDGRVICAPIIPPRIRFISHQTKQNKNKKAHCRTPICCARIWGFFGGKDLYLRGAAAFFSLLELPKKGAILALTEKIAAIIYVNVLGGDRSLTNESTSQPASQSVTPRGSELRGSVGTKMFALKTILIRVKGLVRH